MLKLEPTRNHGAVKVVESRDPYRRLATSLVISSNILAFNVACEANPEAMGPVRVTANL